MNSLKRLKAEGRARREAQEFMIDVLNLMAMSYAIELHEEHGFGAERIARLTGRSDQARTFDDRQIRRRIHGDGS